MGGTGTGTKVSGLASSGGLVVAPAFEPVTLSELKLHLRLDSGAFSDNIDSTQSIAPASYPANVGYALLGTAVEVLGYTAIVNLINGTNGATGTVDCKIQESDDNSTWTDWTGGAFTQVTTANDNATQEIAYTGVKRYIRTVANILLANCVFGTEVIRLNPTTAEDTLLNGLIVASREYVEDITNRRLITQTWDYCLDEWPTGNRIKIPYGNLQSVSFVRYLDDAGTTTTLTVTTDYLVQTNGDEHGYIVLPYGTPWPSDTLYTSNPITIRFICGWTTAALVPYTIKTAMKFYCENLYEHGGQNDVLNRVVKNLLNNNRIYE